MTRRNDRRPKMKKLTGFISLVIVCTSGCMGNFPRPLMFEEGYQSADVYEQEASPWDKKMSTSYAFSGWKKIQIAFSGGEPSMDQLQKAAEFFNKCWEFDHENYNAWWGWGIVFGLMAETDMRWNALAHLQDCIKCFEMAPVKNIPEEEWANFYMDFANACNGLGAYYKSEKENEKAGEILDRGRNLLTDILSKDRNVPGRFFFLLSVNCFYRDDYIQAQYYMQQAEGKNFSVPDSYQKELREKLERIK